MTEETTNTTSATETKSDTFVPAWKIKSDELKKKVGPDEQVVYRSDNYYDCLPVLMPAKQATSVYPYVVEEPIGYIAPKYSWNSENRDWIETASIQQGKEIEILKAQVADLKENNQTATQATQKIDEKVNAITEKSEKYEKSNSQQLGQILTMVSTLLAKSTLGTTPTTPTTNTNTEAKTVDQNATEAAVN